jgi:hypothetical protein
MAHREVAVMAERNQVGWFQLWSTRVDGLNVVDLQLFGAQACLALGLTLEVIRTYRRPLA